MEAVLPAEAVPARATQRDSLTLSRESIILTGLDDLLRSTRSLETESLGALLDARSTLLGLVDGATALSGLVRGLGPEFTQGDWLPMVDTIRRTTSRAHDDLVAFHKAARAHTSSPRLFDSVTRASAAVLMLREEATLLAARGSWAG